MPEAVLVPAPAALTGRPRMVRCLLFNGDVPLTGATGVTADDPLNDIGSGGFTLQNDDSQWAAVQTGAIIQTQVWNEWSESYHDAYLWRIEGKSRQTCRARRSEQLTKYAGRGLAADFERSVVYPHNSPNGEGKIPWGPDRTFGWAAPELDDSAWVAPDVRGIVVDRNSARPQGWKGSPKTFPNPLAQLIWGASPTSGTHDAVGINYFRYDFTTTEELDITFFVTADDWFVAALDGIPIVDFRSNSGDVRNASDQTYWRKLRVPAGDHVFAAKVENLETPGISDNMGGLVVAATYAITPVRSEYPGEGYVWGENYQTFQWLFTTANADSVGGTSPGVSDSWNIPAALSVGTASGTWKSSAYPSTPPGMTPGQILSILFAEAQARGELADWTLGFSSTIDSNSAAWPSIVPDFTVPVGTTFLEVLNKLVSDGYIDWACRPGAVVLDVWAAGTKGSVPAATFSYGDNILQLDHDDKWGATIDSLLVGWDQGFFKLGTGARASFLSIGDAKDQTEASNRAQKQIDRTDDDSTGLVATIWPTAENQIPWASWQTGDSPSLPDWDGNPAQFVSTGIAVGEQGTTGRYTFTTQFVSRRRQAEELAAKLAQRAVPGGLNGRSDSVAPAAPRQEQGGVLELEEFQFDLPGKAADNDTAAVGAGFSQAESGFERTERRIKFMSASLEATDGSIGTTTVDMFMNQDYDHPIITLDLEDAAVEVEDYFGSQVVFGGNLTDNWYIEMGAGEVGGTRESLQVRLRNNPAEHPNLVFRAFGYPIP